MKKRYLILAIMLILLGCSSEADKFNSQEIEMELHNIWVKGSSLQEVYTDMYNGIQRSSDEIESVIYLANELIAELDSVVCYGKYAVRKKKATQAVISMRDDLKLALEQGMEAFRVKAIKTNTVIPTTHDGPIGDMVDDIIYNPYLKGVAIAASVLVIAFIVWKLYMPTS